VEPGLTRNWQEFIRTEPTATVFHTIAWRDAVQASFGFVPHYLLAMEDGHVRSILPIFHRQHWLFGSVLTSVACGNYGGICGGSEEVQDKLYEAATVMVREKNVDYLELRDRQTPRGVLGNNEYCSTEINLADLDLCRSFGCSVRRNVRRAERAGFTFRAGGLELLDEFYPIFRANMKVIGSPAWPRRFLEQLAEAFGQEAVVTVAYDKQVPIAAEFMLCFRKTWYSLFSGSLVQYNRLGVNYFLIWHNLLLARERDGELYDLGRSIMGSGTEKFKRHWRGTRVPLHYNYHLHRVREVPQLNPEKGISLILRQLWRWLPEATTGKLGEKIIPFLH